MKNVRIALVVMNCPVGRNPKNTERVEHWTRQAGKQGAQIVCFPELCISGYTTRAAAADTAEGVPGPATDFLQQIARRQEMVILAGLVEKDDAGRVYLLKYKNVYKLSIGPFASKKAAEAVIPLVQAAGFPYAFVKMPDR